MAANPHNKRPARRFAGAACRALLSVAFAAGPAATLHAQSRSTPPDPVKWALEFEPATAAPSSRLVGRLTATIEPGWHLYAPTTPPGGPIPTKIELAESPLVESWKIYEPPPNSRLDPNFNLMTETYEDRAVFLFDFTLKPDAANGPAEISASANYQACDDRFCLRPVTRTATAALTIAANAAAAAPVIPEDYREAVPAATSAAPPPEVSGAGSAPAKPAGPQTQGLAQFASLAFGFGFLAIFTPCVFPMIPITMSYFVSTQSGEKKASIAQATTFCLGVIVLFTGLGALVSAILGPFGMATLGSNVWVNLFIALIFMAFAASLLGAFEITVPSGALTSLNKMTGQGGIFGTLMMGLVFALASFACTGPFVGALLAGSVGGDITWPIFGMFMFSVGMALPFFFLALFPAYLSKLPRSGGWLARTKITMAFLILAASVKYLSNVDQLYQWHILTRERFLAIWVVLLALGGCYLLGMLRISSDPGNDPVGLGRLGMGAAFLIVAVNLIPGMFGARLGELDAYVPSREYSSFAGLAGAAQPGVKWLKNDYQGALAQAKQGGKTVLVSFTGYACTNCHWMKENMFPKPELAPLLENMVLVELYTDGPEEFAKPNQDLQLERFGSAAIPYYAILNGDGNIIREFAGRTRDVEEFRQFLAAGSPSGV